jgi:hypothetical protein
MGGAIYGLARDRKSAREERHRRDNDFSWFVGRVGRSNLDSDRVMAGAHTAQELDWHLRVLPTSENDTTGSRAFPVEDHVQLNRRRGIGLSIVAQPDDRGCEQLTRGSEGQADFSAGSADSATSGSWAKDVLSFAGPAGRVALPFR